MDKTGRANSRTAKHKQTTKKRYKEEVGPTDHANSIRGGGTR